MFCNHCGSYNPDSADFCGSCGARMSRSETALFDFLKPYQPPQPPTTPAAVRPEVFVAIESMKGSGLLPNIPETPDVPVLKPIKIFCCYARKDQFLLKDLKAHLRPLQRQGLISIWNDTDISPGAEWEKEIHRHLETAQIILLLISPDFMASEYCYSVEMQRALARHDRHEARVIPIILRHVYWQGDPLDKLQALPENALPITDPRWYNRDMAFLNVIEGIIQVVKELNEYSQRSEAVKVVGSMKSKLTNSQSSPQSANSTDRVVVVAARNALPEYLNHSVYICQPNRHFKPFERLAFYTNNKIDRRVPEVVGCVESISKDEIETRNELSAQDRGRLRQLYQQLDRKRRNEWSKPLKIIFLSPPEAQETLILPNDIINTLTSDNGRSIAFTQGQRYVSLASLKKGPKTTSELISVEAPK